MPSIRRVTPYLLLAVLMLGAGLGLSVRPAFATASTPDPSPVACHASDANNAFLFGNSWSGRHVSVVAGSSVEVCLAAGWNAVAVRPRTATALQRLRENVRRDGVQVTEFQAQGVGTAELVATPKMRGRARWTLWINVVENA